MNILVVLRLVPDGEILVSRDGKDIDREWVDMRLNDFDDQALEQAILLKEAIGGKVIAVAPFVDGVNRLNANGRRAWRRPGNLPAKPR